MGCYFFRSDITAEEAAVMNFEMCLGYSELSVIYIDRVQRKYSYKGKISKAQWNDICNILRLAPSSSNSSHHILNYYEGFKDSIDNFSLKKLLILGVMLGNGKPLEKGKLLFEAMDESCCGNLSSEQVRNLFEIMIMIACEMNPRVMLKDEYNDVAIEDLEKYIAKLSRGKENAIHKVVNEITKGCEIVSSREFLGRLSLREMQSFLSAHGIRTFVKKKNFTVVFT